VASNARLSLPTLRYTRLDKTLHKELYLELVKLDKANKNGIWARIIKNSFAPLFIGPVDYVAGNPPWVVWDNLPADYRQDTKPLWEQYGLFSLSASAAVHGGGKKDISMLMLYVSADRYLKHLGKLGFVITQTVFQTKGAGDGFRRFHLGSGEYLCVLHVDDMVRFQPFEGAANWTSTIIIEKGRPTVYPLPYLKWKLVGDLPDEHTKNWSERFEQEELKAQPIDPNRITSPWILLPKDSRTSLAKMTGCSEYHAHLGANSGGANGVFWLNIIGNVGNRLLVKNVAEKSKKKMETVERSLEKDLIYPLIRWLDVSRFKANPSGYLLLTQNPKTRTGLDEYYMKQNYPKTYSYLHEFRDQLLQRAAYKRYQGDAPFYSMYDVGSYTVSPLKVVWRRMDRQINAAVVCELTDKFLGKKPVIPQETCVFIECESLAEAHYLCAMLNSSVLNFIAKSHSVEGGKGFGTPSMLDYLPIKRFQPGEASHVALAELSLEAHKLATENEKTLDVEHKIDLLVAPLLGVAKEDVKLIAKSLEN